MSIKKVDSIIKRETFFIAVSVLLMSILMEAVFLIIGHWSYTVLLGNILGGVAAVGNFFLMGLSVQKAVNNDSEQAPGIMKFSQTMRMLGIFIVVALAALIPFLNLWSTIIPLFFPRIAIMFRPLLDKKKEMSDEQ